MHIASKRNRPLHKFVLYLILANFALIALYHGVYHNISMYGQLMTSTLLVTYNIMLVRILSTHARTASDVYLIYPVVIATMGLSLSVIYQFFIF